ncbi:unnamed protein product [Rotaria sp. Silwood2]|nr:unnamed protein product [Rotaria sp. Silwood2]
MKTCSKSIDLMCTKSPNGRQNHVMNPSSIAAEIRPINPIFRSYTQQDIEEFLRCFMNEFHSKMRIAQSSPDAKHRRGSSNAESSEMPIILLKYISFSLKHRFINFD